MGINSMTGMFRQYLTYLITVSMLTSLLVGCANSDTDSQSKNHSSRMPTEFGKLMASRPAPDLDHLAERSAPDHSGGDATEAFYDILKLRDIGDARAVPVLEKVMIAHVNSTRIHGYAAAQALFCIGTPEAKNILSKYVMISNYNARLGIDYTFHWEMDESKRNSFIERYHLKNLAQNLNVDLNAETYRDEDVQRIEFALRLHNTSDKPFRIINSKVYLGRMLYFRANSGRFARILETVDYNMPMPEWLELAPGTSHRFDITVIVSLGDELKCQTNDAAYDISKTGRFKVYAMLDVQPLTKAQREKLNVDNPWSGRAVSKSIEIVIGK